MSERVKIVTSFYESIDEDARLERSRQGQLEWITTMSYIHRYADSGAKILEIGAGTGRYSIALAKEGYDVTAVELSEHNLEILRRKSGGMENLKSYAGDALDLSMFCDGAFDVTLVLGPLYHLFDRADVDRAIDEAIRVTRAGGVIAAAFLSAHAILFDNYLNGMLKDGLAMNFTADYQVRHFEEQLFTGYDILEFERLFADKQTEHLLTVSADSVLELAEERKNFAMTDDEFEAFSKYHLAVCEKRELLGCSSHLIYLCRKREAAAI